MSRDRIIRIGDKEVYEKTNPDYNDEKIARIARDFRACPKEWQGVFLAGLSRQEIKELEERGIIK